ncbi:MAG: hypothetical protein ABSG52_01265 [Terriglobales bacterium]
MITAPAGGTLLSFAAAPKLTFPPGGGDGGAVYTPAVVMVPQAPGTADWQFSVQFTAMGILLTVAENVCIPPAGMVTGLGLTVNGVAVAGARIVTCTEIVTEVSACDTAVTVTAAGFGTLLGAVNNPVEEMNPTVELPPTTPFTDHDKAVFAVLVTVIVNCCVNPVVTDADVGEMERVTAVVDVELLLPPQAASTARIRNTTTPDKMTRFINHS